MVITDPVELLAAWDRQQTAYIEFREQRTQCVVELLSGLAAELDEPLRLLDLGCGPGSLSNAILDGIPDAHVTGVDRDPVLIRLFRDSTPYPDRVAVVDLDLADPDWGDGLPQTSYHAAVSATALHWLDPHQLVRLYAELGRLIEPGGLVLNADHLFFDKLAAPRTRRFAIDFREAAQRRHLESGALDWDEWWQQALAMPGWDSEAEEFHRRWCDQHVVTPVSADFHLAALQAAGFTEVAQVWQWLDDRILCGRQPQGALVRSDDHM